MELVTKEEFHNITLIIWTFLKQKCPPITEIPLAIMYQRWQNGTIQILEKDKWFRRKGLYYHYETKKKSVVSLTMKHTLQWKKETNRNQATWTWRCSYIMTYDRFKAKKWLHINKKWILFFYKVIIHLYLNACLLLSLGVSTMDLRTASLFQEKEDKQ